MSFQCPSCNKVLKTKKSLARHIKTQHPEQEPAVPTETKKESKAEVLQIKKPESKEKAESETTTSAGYHCIACGGKVTRGQNPCPNCGAELDWSQV